ncbi:MAG: magnesium-translocating P-type ATPase [Propionibacteriaceae bacterium]|nr:magnesium-translocating P-type ATPase [Propionibacteriaceae bacterium]
MQTTIEKTAPNTPVTQAGQTAARLSFAADADIDALFGALATTSEGLDEDGVEDARDRYGDNTISHGKKTSLIKRIVDSFINPFTVILIALAAVSAFTDIILPGPGQENPTTVIIIMTMVIISGALRFTQEAKSGDAAENLLNMITTTISVRRVETGVQEIPLEDVVVGDIVQLAAGDMIPADIRIIRAKDLFISQSALTGESIAVEKVATPGMGAWDTPTECPTLAFMGSDVVSGTATGVVVATGDDTTFASIAHVSGAPTRTGFEKGVNSVSWLLIRFMLVMLPIVLFINGFTKGDWMQAVLFALSVAVGLTPEMLPMIVTTCLAKGAVAMSKKHTIIKNLNSIQNLGSMTILCTDKTGTLTQDKVVLQYHLNIHGQEDMRVLRHAFLNSYYQTGLKNLMDFAIISKVQELQEQNPDLRGLTDRYEKVDEIPFDFERRRMSVVVTNDAAATDSDTGRVQMITKGAVEEMLQACSFVEFDAQVLPLTDDLRAYILKQVERLNNDGMRVLALAQKSNPSGVGVFSAADETDMVLMGYLAFLDPPKESARTAITALKAHGVDVKVLTGDNDLVSRYVCKQVGIPTDRIVLGPQIDGLDDDALADLAEQVSVFAKLSPQQKARVITVLRGKGHAVGYMGDGINDTAAMKVADVGISVDTAVDIAKESADVILLEKDLMVLEAGIREGRITYANMIKYIKLTASSNFGNMLSVLVASAFLPFLPMLPLQIILLNLIYDLSCTAIPWDNVDPEFLRTPRQWEASSISKFIVWFGPTSSIFDITTYLLMYFVIAPAMCGGHLFHQMHDPAHQLLFMAVFQTGWFVESMWTQTLVIHMIRTPKIPFLQSHASAPVTLVTFAGIAVLTVLPWTPIAGDLGLTALPGIYFAYLAATVVCYMCLATLAKRIFVRRYGQLL